MVRVRSSPTAIAVDRWGACLCKTPGVFSTQTQLFTIDSIYAYTPTPNPKIPNNPFWTTLRNPQSKLLNDFFAIKKVYTMWLGQDKNRIFY